MQLIFLDIDGVLNSLQSTIYYNQFPDKISMEDRLCPIATSNLKYILDKFPDCKIIVSSTWRRGRTLEVLNQILGQYNIPQVVIDKTPYEGPGEVRGLIIRKWMDQNPTLMQSVSDFVIIDDDSDMAEFLSTSHFIKTDSKVGFTWKEVEMIEVKFGGFNLTIEQLTPGKKYHLFSKPHDMVYTFDGKDFFYLDENGIKRSGIFIYPKTELFKQAKD